MTIESVQTGIGSGCELDEIVSELFESVAMFSWVQFGDRDGGIID